MKVTHDGSPQAKDLAERLIRSTRIDFEGLVLAERMTDAIERNPLKLNIRNVADDHLVKLLRENTHPPYGPRDDMTRWYLAREATELHLYNKALWDAGA